MTRFGIDAPTALRLIDDDRTIAADHSLVGPAMLRSDAMKILYREVREGRLDDRAGRQQLEALAALKIRLLGDRVSRATAWKIATQLGWVEPAPAEYLAVAQLQADVLVTADPALVAGAQDVIAIADYEDLFRA